MRDFNTNYLPDIFTGTCLETGKFYIYNINNPIDPITGHWRELSADISAWIQTSEVTDSDGNTITTTIVGGIETTVKKDPSGNVIERTGTIGGVTTKTEIDAGGNAHSSVGDKVVSGTKTESKTSTDVDSDGNPVTIVEIIESTPNGTKKIISTETTKPDGGKVVQTETIHGGSDGVDVGAATGLRETTTFDPGGNIVDNKTQDTSYVNGEEELWATEEDIDDLYGSLLGGLGWIL